MKRPFDDLHLHSGNCTGDYGPFSTLAVFMRKVPQGLKDKLTAAETVQVSALVNELWQRALVLGRENGQQLELSRQYREIAPAADTLARERIQRILDNWDDTP